MVLNIGDHDISREDIEDTSDHGSHTDSPTSYPRHSNSIYNQRHENNHRNSNGTSTINETSSEAPLDFSIKRHDRHNSNDDINNSRRNDDVKPPLSPSDSEVGSPSDTPSSSEERQNTRKNTNGYNNKIGEPRLAIPGLLPIAAMNPNGFVLPPGFPQGLQPNMGMLGPLPPLVIDSQTQNQQTPDQNGKSNRPFKSYPKDPLSLSMGYFGMPGAPPLPGFDSNKVQSFSQNASEEMFKRYKDYLAKLQEAHQSIMNSPQNNDLSQHNVGLTMNSPEPNSTQSPPICSPHSTLEIPSQNFKIEPSSSQDSQYYDVNSSLPDSNERSNQNGHSRKRGRLFPEDAKDATYWERRRKNNEAAKRSRDARRAKEDEIAIRAAFLEQENLKLRVEVAALKNETAKLRCMLYNS